MEYITVTGFDGVEHSGFKASKRHELPKTNVHNTNAFYDVNMDMWMVWTHYGKSQTKHYLIKNKRLF